MYAIFFRLDPDSMQLHVGASSEPVAEMLEAKGFAKQAPGFHLGGPTLNAVDAVLTVQAIARELDWFAATVKDLRLVRVESIDNLQLALLGTKVVE